MRSLRTLDAVGVLGAAALAYGGAFDHGKFWPTLLVLGLNPLSIVLGAGVLLALQYVTGARWSRGFEPLVRALTRCYWPAAALVLAALAFGGAGFTGWARVSEGAVVTQRLWLSPPFLLTRSGAYVLIWGALLPRVRGVASAAAFLVVFAVTASLAAFDWLMALNAHWASTIFGVYFFAGAFLGALAAVAVAGISLARAGAAPRGWSDDDLHDLGKMLFGFSVFWAYIWYCQYMLIWYTNDPRETSFFVRRHLGGWAVLSLTSIAMNWAVPFLALLPRWSKRNADMLLRVAAVVLVGHWLDLYVAVMPRFSGAGPSFGLWEGLAFLGALSAFAALLVREAAGPRGARA